MKYRFENGSALTCLLIMFAPEPFRSVERNIAFYNFLKACLQT